MLGFGVGISHCGIRGGVSDAPDFAASAAKALLAGETQGLAFDFTDQSAYILDTGTPANDYDSSGYVTSGALVGPGGKLTYTSPSNKLCRQSDGFYKYGAHNLCLHSEDLSAAGWSSNSATLSADKFLEVAATAEHYAYRTMTSMVSGADYVLSVEVSGIGRDWCALSINDPAASITWFNLAGAGSIGTDNNAGSSITLLSDGYYRVSIRITAGATTIYPVIYSASANGGTSFVGDAAKGLFVRKAHLYRYPANADYIKTTSSAVYSLPYSYDANGACEGLLVEEQRTELALYNTDISNTAFWSNVSINATYSLVGASGPFLGGVWNVIPDATNSGGHRFYRSSTQLTLSTTTYGVMSVFAKANGYPYISLRESNATGACAVFDLSDGTLVNTHNASNVVVAATYIEPIGSGWYRVAAVFNTSSSTSNSSLGVYVNDGSYTSGSIEASTFSGDTTSGVLIALPSYQSGAFPTSPIITYGAAATRAADNISIATTAFPISTTAGTLYGEWNNLSTTVSTNCGIGLHGVTAGNDRAQIRAGAVFVSSGGVNSFNTAPAGYGVSTSYKKYILAYAENDFAACINGNAVSTDVSGATPTSLTTFDFNIDRSTSLCVNGHIKTVSYVPRRKSDAELQSETA